LVGLAVLALAAPGSDDLDFGSDGRLVVAGTRDVGLDRGFLLARYFTRQGVRAPAGPGTWRHMMERRELLRMALGAGATLVVCQLDRPAPAEAARRRKKVRFFSAVLDAAPFAGWTLYLASTGRALRGTLFDPASVGSVPFAGSRVRGTARGRQVTLELFALDDLGFQNPVGSGTAALQRRGVLAGQFSLNGNQGAFRAGVVPISRAETARFVGDFFSTVTGPADELLGAAQVTVGRNGTFEVLNLNTPLGPVPDRVSGRYGLTAAQELWTVSLMPDLEAFRPAQEVVCFSEVQRAALAAPLAGGVHGAADGTICDVICVTCQQLKALVRRGEG
jgi:hypothetical protein